jgi:predicted PurR-regulated permease PerM
VLPLFFLMSQQVENYMLSPRNTGRIMQLRPAVAFGAVLAGANLMGVGAFLALQAAAIFPPGLSSTSLVTR